MAKIYSLRDTATGRLRSRKDRLARTLSVPLDAIRGSCVEQFLTCGKKNCRCRKGRRHGPFYYLVQCLGTTTVRKFLLKRGGAKKAARAGIRAYARFHERLEELSQINAELLRRGEPL